MKKKIAFVVIALVVSLVGVLALASCTSDKKSGPTAAELAAAAAKKQKIAENTEVINARDAYFASATGAENVYVMVVSYSSTTNTAVTEMIKDGVDFVQYGTSFSTYAYTEGSNNYVLTDHAQEKTYTVNAKDFADHCLVWYSFVKAKDNLLDSADFSFKEEGNVMTFEVKVGNNVDHSVSVTKSGDVINAISIVTVDENANTLMTVISLAYGSAYFDQPDINDYTPAA